MSSKPKNLKPSQPPAKHELQFDFVAIGTQWRISLVSVDTSETLANLEKAIRQRITEFDKIYSRFRPDSLISIMSHQAGEYNLPDDAKILLDFYRQLYDVSAGAFTPLIGQALVDAGYDAKYSLRPGVIRDVPAWDDVLRYDFPKLTLKQPALLDVGAAGKGYLVDLVGQLISDYGIKDFVIDAGGDILQRQTSGQPRAIGLEHPDDPEQAIGVARVRNQSICGSAGNRRAWQGFHHLIDPASKRSPTHIRATWVIADTTMLADGLATALFFTRVKQLNQWYTYHYAIIYDDYSLEHSPDFPAEFFVDERPA